MGYLRICCGNCGGSWEIYAAHNAWNKQQIRICPHCNAAIDAQTYRKQIVPAFSAMLDANAELYKDHTGYTGQPMFTVNYVEDRPLRNDLQDLIEDVAVLRSDVAETQETVKRLENIFTISPESLLFGED